MKSTPATTTERVVYESFEPILVESPTDGRPFWLLTGLAGRYDYINRNGRLYPKDVVQAAVDRLYAEDGLITTNQFLTELDHPEPNNEQIRQPLLANSVGIVTRMWLGDVESPELGGPIWFEATLAKTDKGQNVVALIQAGLRIGASTRGMGAFEVQTIRGRRVAVATDFEYEGLDWVAQPSVPDAGIDTVEHRLVQEEPMEEEKLQALETVAEPVVEPAVAPAVEVPVEETKTIVDPDELIQNADEDMPMDPGASSATDLVTAGGAGAVLNPPDTDLGMDAATVDAILTLMGRLIGGEADERDYWGVCMLADIASSLKAWLMSEQFDGMYEAKTKAAIAGVEALIARIESAKQKTEAVVESEALRLVGKLTIEANTRTTEVQVLETRIAELEGQTKRAAFIESVLDRCEGERYATALFKQLTADCANLEEVEKHFEATKALVAKRIEDLGARPEAKTKLPEETLEGSAPKAETEEPLSPEQLRAKQTWEAMSFLANNKDPLGLHRK